MIGDEDRERYSDLFRLYLVEQDEQYLMDVADLGRDFVRLGVPVEEIAELHEWALAHLGVPVSPQELSRVSRPFMELMMAYSLDFKRQVECRIEAENELRKANDELTQIVKRLEIYQRVFDALPLGVSVFRQHDRSVPDSLEFVLGNPASESTRVRIEKESFSIADSLQEDFLDEERSFSDACAQAIRRGKSVDLGVSDFEDEMGRSLQLHTMAFPLFGDHVGLYIEDVTEQMKLEAQLHRVQKMEAVGRLAGGIAHDFNNVLTTIFGFAELAAEQVEEQSAVHRDISQVLSAAERAAALTRQLLSFSRRQGEPRVINPNSQIDAVDGMIRSLLEEDVQYSVQYAENLGSVRIDPGALEQVIINLVINARDAIAKGGRISIETENFQAYEEEASRSARVEPGEYVSLSVSDNGIGMSEEVQRKIFEPFFTTKAVGKGTGLGLYICSDLVKQAGGAIQLLSKAGKGTRFRIILPRVNEESESLVESIKRKKVLGSETILLAEDDQGIRRSVSRALRDSGYEVLSASSGEEALSICESFFPEIDLLLTDVIMPELDGRQLAGRVTSLYPDVKVLFMSGYTGEALDRRSPVGFTGGMIQKPFTIDSLVRRVREVLDSNKVDKGESPDSPPR